MNVIISGICGHMGAEVAKAVLASKDAVIIGGVDVNASGSVFGIEPVKSFPELACKADCIIDFSHHSLTEALVSYAKSSNTPLVVATTGQTPEEKKVIEDAASSIPVFFAANYSMGVTLLIKMAKQVAAAMPDAEIEIVEKHHDRKIDSPSGTALAIANAIKTVRPQATFNCGRSGYAKREPNEIGISSVRLGNIVGEHEVLVGTQNETLTLAHTAYSRAVFADGALEAARFLLSKGPGLYKMDDLLK